MTSKKRKKTNTASSNSPAKRKKAGNKSTEPTTHQESQQAENVLVSKTSINFLLNTEPPPAPTQQHTSSSTTSKKASYIFALSDKEMKKMGVLRQCIAGIGIQMEKKTVFTNDEFDQVIKIKKENNLPVSKDFKIHHMLVEKYTLEHTTKTREKLAEALASEDVLTYSNARNYLQKEKKYAYKASGEDATYLPKEELDKLKKDGTVVSLAQYYRFLKEPKYIDPLTGKAPTETGEELAKLIADKRVIAESAYRTSQRKKEFVFRANGESADHLSAEELKKGIDDLSIMNSTAYSNYKSLYFTMRDLSTGKPTRLKGKALEEAIKNGTVGPKMPLPKKYLKNSSQTTTSISSVPRDFENEPATLLPIAPTNNAVLSTANTAFGFFSASRPIKQEPASPIENPQIDLTEVMQKLSRWMKEQRKDNNTLDNCSHLTYHALLALENLLNSKEIPQGIIPTSPSADTTPTEIKHSYVPIKTEDGKRRGKQLRTAAIASVTTTEGLHSILPPVAQTVIDVTSEPIKETSIVDLEPKKVPATKIKHTAINQELMQLAKEKNKVLIGTVDLAYTGRQHISHSIVFCVTPEEIFYLDGQLHNGITKQGEPIFSDLTIPFEFATTVYGKTEGDFADDCFYTVYRELPVDLKPADSNPAQSLGKR